MLADEGGSSAPSLYAGADGGADGGGSTHWGRCTGQGCPLLNHPSACFREQFLRPRLCAGADGAADGAGRMEDGEDAEDGSMFALHGVNMGVAAGELVCVVGRVGSGKTSLVGPAKARIGSHCAGFRTLPFQYSGQRSNHPPCSAASPLCSVRRRL